MALMYAIAGAKLYIGGVLEPEIDDFDASDFAAVDAATWVEIDGWATAGTFGDTATEINQALINRGRNVKMKGTRDAGSMENTFISLPADPGQVAVKEAEKTIKNYEFMIRWPDGANGAAGSSQRFVGLVMSAAEAGGEANTARMLNVTIGINSNIVQTAAA